MILTISLFGRKSLQPSRDSQGLMYLSCHAYVSKNIGKDIKKELEKKFFNCLF